MALTKLAYQDAKGGLHDTPDSATISDLEAIVGNYAQARQVFDYRADLERIFAEHDRMAAHEKAARPLT